MATTTGSNNLYEIVKNRIATGTLDMDAGGFRVTLCTSAYTPNAATHQDLNDLTNEVAGTNIQEAGAPRIALSNPAWEASSGANGQQRFDADNPVWTASGGDFTAHYWVLYDDTPAADADKTLIAYGFLNSAGGGTDVTTTDGNTLTLNLATDGFFTLG